VRSPALEERMDGHLPEKSNSAGSHDVPNHGRNRHQVSTSRPNFVKQRRDSLPSRQHTDRRPRLGRTTRSKPGAAAANSAAPPSRTEAVLLLSGFPGRGGTLYTKNTA